MENKKLNLYDLLVELSGIERSIIDQELGFLIKKLDLDPNNLSTDDIRRIATLYLYEIQGSKLNDLTAAGNSPRIDGTPICQAEA